MYYIYEITNIINGKTYIGQRKCPQDISPESDKYMGSGKILKCAILKYGLENFNKRILVSGIKTQKEIDSLEIYWIAKYKKIGKAEYNIAKGGGGGCFTYMTAEGKERHRKRVIEGHKNMTPEKKEEARRKLSETYKNMSPEKKKEISKRHSEAFKNMTPEIRAEWRRKLSEAFKNMTPEIRAEWRRKLSETKKKIHLSEEGRKKLREYHKNMTPEERKERARKISKTQKEKYKSGYTRNHLKKAVICIELNKTFGSCKEAGESLGIARSSISSVLSGRYLTAGGYHWRYAFGIQV